MSALVRTYDENQPALICEGLPSFGIPTRSNLIYRTPAGGSVPDQTGIKLGRLPARLDTPVGLALLDAHTVALAEGHSILTLVFGP